MHSRLSVGHTDCNSHLSLAPGGKRQFLFYKVYKFLDILLTFYMNATGVYASIHQLQVSFQKDMPACHLHTFITKC